MRILLIFLTVCLIGCETRPNPIDTSWTTVRDSNGQLIVATGIRNGELLFVAIARGDADSKESVPSIVSGGPDNTFLLNRADGTTESLPNGTQLFEHTAGRWDESQADVTIAEYEAFCQSQPAEFTIDSLLEYVESMRIK